MPVPDKIGDHQSLTQRTAFIASLERLGAGYDQILPATIEAISIPESDPLILCPADHPMEIQDALRSVDSYFRGSVFAATSCSPVPIMSGRNLEISVVYQGSTAIGQAYLRHQARFFSSSALGVSRAATRSKAVVAASGWMWA